MLQFFSHVKWFTSRSPSGEPAFDSVEWLAVLGIVSAGLLVFRIVDGWLKKRKIEKKLDQTFKPYRSLVPLVVRVSTALLLVINALNGFILAPNVESDGSGTAGVITILFLGAAVFIGFGYMMQVGIVSLLGGYLLAFVYADFFDAIDHIEYVAIAAYLWLRGPGVYSLEKTLAKKKLKNPIKRHLSLDVYRIGVGIGLVVLSLSEKLLNVSVAQDFLNQHSWNILSFAGVSDRNFILVAGAVELLVGLGLILNYAPRVLITIVLILMILTAILLGIEEIYGHLFAVGIVAALWVNDARPAKSE